MILIIVLEIDTPNKKVATPTLLIPLTPSSPSVQPTPDYAAALGTDDNMSYNMTTPLSSSVTIATTNTASVQSSFSNEVIQSILSNPNTPTTTGPNEEQQRNIMEERQRLLQQMQDNSSTTPTTAVTTPTPNKQPNRLKLSVSVYMY